MANTRLKKREEFFDRIDRMNRIRGKEIFSSRP